MDRHLARVAEAADELRAEVEELRAASASPQPLSGAAADQIRLIVQAAEQSAAAIETNARETADRQSEEAEARARELVGLSQSHVESLVTRVDEAADLVLRRMDRLESEIAGLRGGADSLSAAIDSLQERSTPLREQVEELRAGVTQLRDDPDAALSVIDRGGTDGLGADESLPREPLDSDPTLESERDDAPTETHDVAPAVEERGSRRGRRGRDGAAATPEPRGAEEEIVPEATAEPAILSEEEIEDETELEQEEELLEGELDLAREDELRAAELSDRTASEPSGGDDEEGARLVALNMALNGVPREETDRYLAENFSLGDRGTVLDDVYARVGDA